MFAYTPAHSFCLSIFLLYNRYRIAIVCSSILLNDSPRRSIPVTCRIVDDVDISRAIDKIDEREHVLKSVSQEEDFFCLSIPPVSFQHSFAPLQRSLRTVSFLSQRQRFRLLFPFFSAIVDTARLPLLLLLYYCCMLIHYHYCCTAVTTIRQDGMHLLFWELNKSKKLVIINDLS